MGFIWGLGLGFQDALPPILEKQAQKNMEDEMETGGIEWSPVGVNNYL